MIGQTSLLPETDRAANITEPPWTRRRAKKKAPPAVAAPDWREPRPDVPPDIRRAMDYCDTALQDRAAFARWLTENAEIDVGDRNDPGINPVSKWLRGRCGRYVMICGGGVQWRIHMDYTDIRQLPAWAARFLTDIETAKVDGPKPITGADALRALGAVPS